MFHLLPRGASSDQSRLACSRDLVQRSRDPIWLPRLLLELPAELGLDHQMSVALSFVVPRPKLGGVWPSLALFLELLRISHQWLAECVWHHPTTELQHPSTYLLSTSACSGRQSTGACTRGNNEVTTQRENELAPIRLQIVLEDASQLRQQPSECRILAA